MVTSSTAAIVVDMIPRVDSLPTEFSLNSGETGEE
jgi:hypothetical protein